MAVEDGLHKQHVDHAETIYATNAHYVACADRVEIRVQHLDQEQSSFPLPFATKRFPFIPVLALSPIRHNLLAVANGSRIIIFNVAKKKARCILKGNGRTVTSISFSEREYDIVATGTVDGNICIWSIKHASRPLYQFSGFDVPCHRIAIHSLHTGLVACCHEKRLTIWSIAHPQLLAGARVTTSDLRYISWRSKDSVVGFSRDGYIAEVSLTKEQTFRDAWKKSVSTQGLETPFDATFWEDSRSKLAVCSISPDTSVQQVMVLGSNGLVVLLKPSDLLYFYSYSLNEITYTELWQLRVDFAIHSFALRHVDGGIDVFVVGRMRTQEYSVPVPVLDAMRWSNNEAWTSAKSGTVSSTRPAGGRMLPVETYRREALSKSGLVEVKLARETFEELRRKKTTESSRPEALRAVTYPVRPMTSSLELPKEHNNNGGTTSPMPFLSPSIPARRESSGLLAPLEEDLSFLPRASFDSTTSNITHGHDSDSDDETFAGNLRHSGSLPPGRVNVPLPRTCGAAFAPNGHLVTFFPLQTRLGSAVEKATEGREGNKDERSSEAADLFPTFGVFGLSSTSPNVELGRLEPLSRTQLLQRSPITVQTSIFDHRPSWPAKLSPVKATLGSLPAASKISVCVRELETLIPTRKALANSYTVFAECVRSAADLSRSNADAAALAGMNAASEAWSLLALILEETSLGSEIHHFRSDRHPLASKRHLTPARDDLLAPDQDDIRLTRAAVLQSSHPLGKMWAIDRLFAVLEQQADMQLLACMSAVLVGAAHTEDFGTNTSQNRSTLSKYVLKSDQVSENQSVLLDTTMWPPSIPVLRTNSSALTISERPLFKRKASQSSSRNASQPSTPYLDSTASTPPLALLSLARSASKLSNSGSASPEHHRSSFSIAAKNYAASIAEKFASYGSSPPTKRSGTSPANELSTSLPNVPATGSWSKSVSFASTLGVDEVAERSLSIAQEDDKYDSDRTIDDSVPQAFKTSNTSVLFRLKNESHFHRTTPQGGLKPLPEEFLMKSAIWRHYHAEQLRSWDLIQKAAELEALSNARRPGIWPNIPQPEVKQEGQSAVSGTICIVCCCLIQSAMQLCPACLHSAHPSCLNEFIGAMDDECFTCPSGCGCDCGRVMEFSSIVTGSTTELG